MIESQLAEARLLKEIIVECSNVLKQISDTTVVPLFLDPANITAVNDVIGAASLALEELIAPT